MIDRMNSLARDERGATMIETAIVVPVLLLMAIGAFESGNMISRQVELQNAAAEAAQIAIAQPPTDAITRGTLEDIIEMSTGLADENVTVAEAYRCGTDAAYVDSATSCTDAYASFIEINLTDSYTPVFWGYAFDSVLDYDVTRMVQIG